MKNADLTPLQRQQLADKTRERFVGLASKAMVELGGVVQDRLTAALSEKGSAKEVEQRTEAWTKMQHGRGAWVDAVLRVWQTSLRSGGHAPSKQQALDSELGGLSLEGEDTVENKIITSRLVIAVQDKAGSEFEDLQVRLKHLEGLDELGVNDLMRPNMLLLPLIEEWGALGMPRGSWALINDAVRQHLADRLKQAYVDCNQFLVSQGILPSIQLKDRVKRPTALFGQGRGAATPGTAEDSDFGASRPSASSSGGGFQSSQLPSSSSAGPRKGWAGGKNEQAGGAAGSASSAAGAGGMRQGAAGASTAPGGDSGRFSPGGTQDETRLQTNINPLGRARMRAQGVVDQLKRLLIQHGDTQVDSMAAARAASPRLAKALSNRGTGLSSVFAGDLTHPQEMNSAGVARLAVRLREESNELKRAAETKSEKAIIEIVALMFQAILAEERIPPSIRVWFARLQMPVLRVALADAEFFGTISHPARQLIDRMGSTVMGFEANEIEGSALELEIKRIVQLIEQYPETGRRVFQIAHDEFQAFLARYLTERETTRKLISVAQQVEQRETFAIQYTIEMRNLFKDLPMREEIRAFLNKVWAEVLAMTAMRSGGKSEEASLYKKTAADLVWAAAAKPDRADRARVIQQLPQLLQNLRAGMSVLALPTQAQDEHVKTISDILAEAFLAKTQPIPREKFQLMVERLAHLEDFLAEEQTDGEIPLDAFTLENMLGIDASSIVVVSSGGSKASPAMVAWVKELQLGTWFKLDHNGRVGRVQYAWRSARKHLHLFVRLDGHCYLIQSGKLADYLQAGLLVPGEEEALSVRATRDALTKIEANPERLVQ